ncbi:MAG: hypothetical protein KJ868_19700, partial [Gammaproteobacteria bacterium]|nr:hypothetical protein [Gammaproteobacteria bacterium]
MTQPKPSNFAWQDRNLIAKWKSALDIIDSKGQAVFTELFDYVEPQQGPLNGAIVSIKDLFQVEGYKTQAGSVFISQQLAEQDS